ncbi:unnamed protein product, partial [Adineta steineri]
MLPVTSRGTPHNVSVGIQLLDLPLVSVFIPSFLATIESDYDYRLYIGYDYGDMWYDNDTNWDKLLSFITTRITDSSHLRLNVSVRPILLFGVEQRITPIWNTLATAAYKDMCDYFYPANDDILIRTKGWTSAAIRTLKTCVVASNFGIVTFKDLNNCVMPTFHLVHRTHLDLHEGIYYPLPTHGDGQDPWIFGVYRPWKCAFFIEHYELKNRVVI